MKKEDKEAFKFGVFYLSCCIFPVLAWNLPQNIIHEIGRVLFGIIPIVIGIIYYLCKKLNDNEIDII